jgi:hypothetical protein
VGPALPPLPPTIDPGAGTGAQSYAARGPWVTLGGDLQRSGSSLWPGPSTSAVELAARTLTTGPMAGTVVFAAAGSVPLAAFEGFANGVGEILSVADPGRITARVSRRGVPPISTVDLPRVLRTLEAADEAAARSTIAHAELGPWITARRLGPPRFDGLLAADGRLFVAEADGVVAYTRTNLGVSTGGLAVAERARLQSTPAWRDDVEQRGPLGFAFTPAGELAIVSPRALVLAGADLRALRAPWPWPDGALALAAPASSPTGELIVLTDRGVLIVDAGAPDRPPAARASWPQPTGTGIPGQSGDTLRGHGPLPVVAAREGAAAWALLATSDAAGSRVWGGPLDDASVAPVVLWRARPGGDDAPSVLEVAPLAAGGTALVLLAPPSRASDDTDTATAQAWVERLDPEPRTCELVALGLDDPTRAAPELPQRWATPVPCAPGVRPVASVATNTVYVLGATEQGWELQALALRTGEVAARWPLGRASALAPAGAELTIAPGEQLAYAGAWGPVFLRAASAAPSP